MESARNQLVYDVIIAGAGPVGLFLACELALGKCSVLVLEKAEQLPSPLKQLPFGMRGLNAHSVEALHRRGLLHELEVPQRVRFPHATPLPGPAPNPRWAATSPASSSVASALILPSGRIACPARPRSTAG